MSKERVTLQSGWMDRLYELVEEANNSNNYNVVGSLVLAITLERTNMLLLEMLNDERRRDTPRHPRQRNRRTLG